MSRHLRPVLLAFSCSVVAFTGAALVHAQVGVRPADQWIATLDNPQRIASQISPSLGLGAIDDGTTTPAVCRAWNVAPESTPEPKPAMSRACVTIHAITPFPL